MPTAALWAASDSGLQTAEQGVHDARSVLAKDTLPPTPRGVASGADWPWPLRGRCRVFGPSIGPREPSGGRIVAGSSRVSFGAGFRQGFWYQVLGYEEHYGDPPCLARSRTPTAIPRLMSTGRSF